MSILNCIDCQLTWNEIWPTLITALLGIIQFIWNVKHRKREELIDLHKRLESILNITITYPYLEHESITNTWKLNMHSNEEKYCRYYQFCTILFNYLESVYRHFDYDEEKVQNFLDVRSWVKIHRQIWLNPLNENENSEGYPARFVKIIDAYARETEEKSAQN